MRLHRLVVVLSVLLLVPAWVRADDAQPSPAESLKRLKDGNARFVADKPATKPALDKRRAELDKGQHPFAIVLGCADSRVVPEMVFDQGLGELFVIRVAGNVTSDVTIGSIEYAVEHLHVPLVVVLGHEKCGAVKAAVDDADLEGSLRALLRDVHTGRNLPTEKDAALAAAVRNNALYHATELAKRSAVIKDFERSGRIRIVTGVYSLKTGAVEWIEKKP